ncbi:MAG: selenocysteine-specific translation elongation factor, partial [Anaerolineaceae bacterium]|nr:selenocysteine-specific translation elongation factor [Anaerolineaceae bacterium]
MRVIGTAGHVDHGKSTLVEALTGIHPDRLKEEQLREMTIDLGFAWLKLPGGEEIGIVDVPGHRDFIENMLAGVGGIDCVLFVVAADEGVMPQTREHLAIIDLLGIPAGILVITKTDRVIDPDWIDLVEQDLRRITDGSVLENAPLLRVSARTRSGLDELINRITEVLSSQPPRPDYGHPRLPIDRVFSVPGFGTVVTGTLSDGSLKAGEEVEVWPGEIRARIRGLQSHKHKLDAAQPGSRVAVNLSNLAVDQLKRGDVVTLPGSFQSTRRLDVSVKLLKSPGAPLKHNQQVKFFLLATETTARIRLLGVEILKPGETGFLQLELDQAICAVRGDRFILRQPSPAETIGGGEVLDPHPPGRHKRFTVETLTRVSSINQDTPEEMVWNAVHDAGIATLDEIRENTRLEPESLSVLLDTLLNNERVIRMKSTDKRAGEEFLISGENWFKLSRKAVSEITRYHAANPLRSGLPREELKSRLKLATPKFNVILQRMADEGILELDQNSLRLPGHVVRLSDGQLKWLAPLMARFAAAPFAPPPVRECV